MVCASVGLASCVAGAAGLVLLSPLRDVGPRSLQVEYEKAQHLFLHGYLEKSQAAAENGYKRSRTTNPDWAAKFQLLKAEVMVWRGFYDDALRILASNSPPVGDSNEVIRKLTLEGVALTRLQRFSAADQNLLRGRRDFARANFSPLR